MLLSNKCENFLFCSDFRGQPSASNRKSVDDSIDIQAATLQQLQKLGLDLGTTHVTQSGYIQALILPDNFLNFTRIIYYMHFLKQLCNILAFGV